MPLVYERSIKHNSNSAIAIKYHTMKINQYETQCNRKRVKLHEGPGTHINYCSVAQVHSTYSLP